MADNTLGNAVFWTLWALALFAVGTYVGVVASLAYLRGPEVLWTIPDPLTIVAALAVATPLLRWCFSRG